MRVNDNSQKLEHVHSSLIAFSCVLEGLDPKWSPNWSKMVKMIQNWPSAVAKWSYHGPDIIPTWSEDARKIAQKMSENF